MYSPYGFHSMSQQYREEALKDARRRHLEGWLRAQRRSLVRGERTGAARGAAQASPRRWAWLDWLRLADRAEER